MSSSYCNHIKRAFFSWNKEVMIHKRHNYSMQCRQDAAERAIFFMHKRLLLQVFYTVIKFLWMRRLDWIFLGLLGGVWKARYLPQLLYNFGICWRSGGKVQCLIPISLTCYVIWTPLNSVGLHPICICMRIKLRNSWQKAAGHLNACCKNPNHLREKKPC